MTQLQIDEPLLQQLRKGQNININISQMQMNHPGSQEVKSPGDDGGAEGQQQQAGKEIDIIPVESILPNNTGDDDELLLSNKSEGPKSLLGDNKEPASHHHPVPPLHIQVSRSNDSSLRQLGAIELAAAEPE